MSTDQNQPDNFEEIFQVKALLDNIRKRNVNQNIYHQISFKHFAQSFSIPKLFLKV